MKRVDGRRDWSRADRLRDRLWFAVLSVVFLGMITPASAQLVSRDASDRRMAFFVSGDGSVGFVLDRTGPQMLLRFKGAPEPVVVRSSPAARGDMLLHNESGDVILRLTSFGPATYYPKGDLRGIPVLRAGKHDNPPARKMGISELRSDAARLAADVSIALGNSVVFDADWESLPKTGTITLGEAVANAANALDNLAKEPDSQAVLAAQLNRVRFEKADMPGLRQEGRTLYVEFTDALGLSGRPSSASIMSFLREQQ